MVRRLKGGIKLWYNRWRQWIKAVLTREWANKVRKRVTNQFRWRLRLRLKRKNGFMKYHILRYKELSSGNMKETVTLETSKVTKKNTWHSPRRKLVS